MTSFATWSIRRRTRIVVEEHEASGARAPAERHLHADSNLEALLAFAVDLCGDEGTPPALAQEGSTIDLS